MIKLKFAALIASGAVVALGGAAVAQQSPSQGGNMQHTPMQSGQMQPKHSGMSALSSSEKQFLQKSTQDSLTEFATAQLALQKAQNPQVAEYATRLINDHAQDNLRLMQLARQKGVVLPVTLDSQGKSQVNRLMQLQGAAFDRQFEQETTQANKSDLQDLQRAAKTLKDRDIQAFISQTIPVQQQHLQLATALKNGSNTSSSRPMEMMGNKK